LHRLVVQVLVIVEADRARDIKFPEMRGHIDAKVGAVDEGKAARVGQAWAVRVHIMLDLGQPERPDFRGATRIFKRKSPGLAGFAKFLTEGRGGHELDEGRAVVDAS